MIAAIVRKPRNHGVSRAALAVLAAAVLFGSTGTAQALGPPGTTPLGVGALRLLVGAATLVALSACRTAGPPMRLPLPRRLDVVAGAVGVAVYQPGFFLGTERSGVALGTIMALGSAPIFAGLLQWRRTRSAPSSTWVVATGLALVGGTIVAFGRDQGATLSVAGIAGSLTAGFGYALFAMTTRRLIDHGVESTRTLAWQFSLGALALLPLVLREPLQWLQTGSGLLLAAHLGLIATGLAYWLYGWGLRSLPAATAVTLTLFEPVTAALAAAILLGERLQWYGWLGAAVVVSGLGIASREPAALRNGPQAKVSHRRSR